MATTGLTKVNSLFPKQMQRARASKLQSVTMRGFGGGWNAIDDDINMSTRYCTRLINYQRTPSGAQELRFGSQFFTDVSDVASGSIVDQEYFNGRIISVMTTGEIVATDDDGTNTVLWNSALAALQPGAPSGWTAGLDSIDFVPFKNKLIIHNGIDKPVIIDNLFVTRYLQDEATGSNVNVPIGKYGCTAANYHVVAGIPTAPTTIYIASVGTSGTFPGDPAPNDAISIDVGAYAPDGGAEIRGIAGFRNYLVIFFRAQSVIMQLGVYDTDTPPNHTPQFNDELPHYGLLGHRCIAHIENDLIFSDSDGMNSAKRSLFSGFIDSTHLSDYIAPEYQGTMGVLTEEQTLKDTFAIYDRLNNNLMQFAPTGRVFIRSASDKLRYNSMSEFIYGVTEAAGFDPDHIGDWTWADGSPIDWAGVGVATGTNTWTCGCTSFLGRVFVGRGSKIFQLGNRVFTGENYHADLLGDRDGMWMNNTAYVSGDVYLDGAVLYRALVSHTSALLGSFASDRAANPTYWELYEGEAIPFDLELPWQDGKDPMKLKAMRFLEVATKGTAEFSVSLYVDNLYRDVDGMEIHDPALTLDLIGNDARGFGDSVPFGGGRKSMDPRLMGFPVRFKIAKFRITGATRRPLMIIGMSFLFSIGAFKR